MKKIYIGSNNKMNKTVGETEEFLKGLSSLTGDISRDDVTIFFIPPFTSLDRAKHTVSSDDILIGAQNMYWEYEGQYTGEIGPRILADIGVDIILVGHSERRHVLGETDEECNKKVLSALKYGFDHVLLCIGETGEQKAMNLSDEVLSMQIKMGLSGVDPKDAGRIWIGYEPVWAIGVGGTPASADYAEEKHAVIKAALREVLGDASEEVPVLYGGSVNRENCEELSAQEHVDGLFIGRAAWQADSFNDIIRAVLPVFKSK